MMNNYRIFITAVTLLASSACTVTSTVVNEPHTPQAIHEQSTRITDTSIERDITYINSLRHRLEVLNRSGTQMESYHFCKVQAWVDMAFDEYTDNDRSEVVAASLQQAEFIVTGLEQGAPVSMKTPIIATSTYQREDLWATAESVKSSVAFECTACDVARLEVQLVWIGHEMNELGWRHAESEIMAAERLERGIRKNVAGCEGIEETLLHLPDRLHFSHDSTAISAQTAKLLDRITRHLQSGTIIRIRIKGYADETGNSDYNHALSERRASAVRDYLLGKGISPERLTLRAYGELEPAKPGRSRQALAYNRRVELLLVTANHITVENLYKDLQP